MSRMLFLVDSKRCLFFLLHSWLFFGLCPALPPLLHVGFTEEGKPWTEGFSSSFRVALNSRRGDVRGEEHFVYYDCYLCTRLVYEVFDLVLFLNDLIKYT